MPRNITITFEDGTSHTYQNAPDSLTPDVVQARAEKDFGKSVTGIDGGKKDSGIMQGAGNTLAGLVRGAGSIGATLLAPVDMAKDAMAGKGFSLESNRQRRADMDSALSSMGAETDSFGYGAGKLAGEVAGTAGVPGVLAKGAQALKAAPALVQALRTGGLAANGVTGAKGMALRTAAGALGGGVSAGMVNPEDVKTGAVIGGVLPGAGKLAGMTGEKIGKALRGSEVLSPEVKALAQRAADLGIDVPADRLGDSKFLNAITSGLNYVPGSGRAATEQKMTDQLAKAASNLVGENTSNLTKALRDAKTTIGGKFDTFLKGNTISVDQALKDGVDDVLRTAEKELGPDALKPIQNQVAEIFTKGASGQIDGQAAYNIKKSLDRIGKGTGNEAFHARQLRDALMDALERSVGPQAAADFKVARQQYGNMKSLEKIAQNGAEGDISVARLANMKNIGNSQLQELADIAAQFVKPREAQHGSMQRAFAALGIGGAVGLPALAGTMAGGRLANTLLNSQSAKQLMLNPATVPPGLIEALRRGALAAPVAANAQ
jgi:hypothetical protein